MRVEHVSGTSKGINANSRQEPARVDAIVSPRPDLDSSGHAPAALISAKTTPLAALNTSRDLDGNAWRATEAGLSDAGTNCFVTPFNRPENRRASAVAPNSHLSSLATMIDGSVNVLVARPTDRPMPDPISLTCIPLPASHSQPHAPAGTRRS